MNALLRALNRLLGPPYPAARTWRRPAPNPDAWDPPGCDRVGDGFRLADMICYQRGRYPPDVFDQFVSIDADRFEHTTEYVRRCIEGLAFDFLIVAMEGSTVKAGCMVEFRCGKGPPYLYISSLCTVRKYGGQGLAHRMVDAVKALGLIMLREKPQGYPIPGPLYIGLTVRKLESEKGIVDDVRLMKLYHQCGLTTRTRRTPPFRYRSFTESSIYNWDLDQDSKYTAMWMQVDAAAPRDGRL